MSDVLEEYSLSFERFFAQHRSDFIDDKGNATPLLQLVIVMLAVSLAYKIMRALNSN